MDTTLIYKDLNARLAEAERVLVGIGAEWKTGDEAREDMIAKAAENLKEALKERDYFVVSTLSMEETERLGLDPMHMVTPLDVSLTEEQWNGYTNWLSRTLNRRLVILELGESFLHPSIVRWPFERTALINNKAYMYRVHKTFYQISDEIREKASAVKGDSVEFIGLWERMAGQEPEL